MDVASLQGRSILVVEDYEDHRRLARYLLESLGARVVEAMDGLEGLLQLEREPVDGVLCDLSMPIMDGLEFARRVRQDPRHRRLLLVALTAQIDLWDLRQTWAAGFDAHLVKPITVELLTSVARRLAHADDVGAAAGG